MNTKRFRLFFTAAALAVFAATAHVSVAAQGHTGHGGNAQTGHSGHGGHSQAGHDMPYDLHFIDMMMHHHREGVEMARLAEEKSANARVKAFAAKTIEGQEKELAQLQWHRDNLYAGHAQMDHAQMMAHMENMPGHEGMKMDMEADMRKLRSATGVAFDRLFIETMTHHHKMAVGMSKEAQTKAEHAEVRELARKSAVAQQKELAEMNAIRAALGGASAKKKAAPAKKKAAPAKKAPAKKASGHGHGGHPNH